MADFSFYIKHCTKNSNLFRIGSTPHHDATLLVANLYLLFFLSANNRCDGRDGSFLKYGHTRPSCLTLHRRFYWPFLTFPYFIGNTYISRFCNYRFFVSWDPLFGMKIRKASRCCSYLLVFIFYVTTWSIIQETNFSEK